MLWSVRWNKVLRGTWQHKAKSILVILAIALGVATFGMWIEYAFSYWGIALWLVVAALVSAVASLLPARRASRISVREALAYE